MEIEKCKKILDYISKFFYYDRWIPVCKWSPSIMLIRWRFIPLEADWK